MSVTSYKHDPFKRARIKLAVFYTLGILILVVIFSVSVYVLFSNNAVDSLEYQGTANESDANMEAQIVENAQNRLAAVLYIVDGLIILLAAGVSYYVAGKTLRPVEDAYAAQKKFVADAAHELRTPLTVLRTGAEAVLGDEGEYERYIRDSLEESEFLTVMVNDLLFLARESDPGKAEHSRLDLDVIVRRQTEFMKPYAEKKAVKLVCADGLSDEFQVRGNEGHLKRLLTNLIRNAIDYNREHGEVDISLRRSRHKILLTITDTGRGIDPAEIVNVYERFYKADAARSGAGGGAGLGLSIAREIVEAHQGKIDIRSEPGRGTEVTVSLPAA